MSHQIQYSEVVIENGETVQTDSVDVIGFLPSGIIIPAGFEGTEITFQACDTATGTFLACYDSAGTELTVTCAAQRHVLIEPQTFAGARFLKLVAGTVQTGDITLKVAMHQEG